MNITQSIIAIVFMLIIIIFSDKFFNKSAKKEPQVNEHGDTVLRSHKAYTVIGTFGVLFTIFIVYITAISLNELESILDLLLAIGLIFFFLGLSIPLILMTKNVKVEFNNERIRYYGLLGKTKEITWNEIKEVKVNNYLKELILKTETTKIKLNMQLVGFSAFIEKMVEKLDESLYKDQLDSQG